MTIEANRLRSLLDEIRAERIAPIGVEDYVQVGRLLLVRPDLAKPEAREELRHVLASLLATDVEQLSKIWTLSKKWLDDAPVSLATPIGRQTDLAALADAPIPTAQRALRALVNLPRWLQTLSGLALLLVLGVLFLFLPRCNVSHVVVTTPSPPTPALESPAHLWDKVPLKQPEDSINVVVPNWPRHMLPADYLAFSIGGALIVLGGCWVVLPYYVWRKRRKRAEANGKRSLEQRREMSREAERTNVSRRLKYTVQSIPPLRDDAAADAATMLGRLFGRSRGSGLDVDRTIDATVAEGGRFVPVLSERRDVRSLTVLVDVEGGSHPWLGDVNWLLNRWYKLGVMFRRYEYQFEPLFLTDAGSGLHTDIEKLARRASGEPLLVISRRLIAQEFHGEARWLRHTRAWPTCAWLDPSPRPLEEIPEAYRAEIDRLARRGFRRFPFTERGLLALSGFLVSEGRSVLAPEWPELPALSDRDVAEALEKWALFASLVPDPTWEQLQAVRETFPEIRAVFPENRHLQRLLDWVEIQNGGKRAESSDGITLELDPHTVDELIVRYRSAEAGRSLDLQFESACRRLLLAQLGATGPEDPLMHQFWQLKRMHHELLLDPEKALNLLGPLIAGPWHHEALEMIGTELKRNKTVKTLPSRMSDAMRLAVDHDSNLLGLRDLLHLPPVILAPVVVAMSILVGLSLMLIKNISPMRDTLLSVKSNFPGIVPRDFRLVAAQLPAAPRQTNPVSNGGEIRQRPGIAAQSTQQSKPPLAAQKMTPVSDSPAQSGQQSSVSPSELAKENPAVSDLLRELAKIDPKAQDGGATDGLIKKALVTRLDRDGSGDLNTREEIAVIDCDVIHFIDDLAFKEPGNFSLYIAYGFKSDLLYVGHAIGINEVLRADFADLLRKCGARGTK